MQWGLAHGAIRRKNISVNIVATSLQLLLPFLFFQSTSLALVSSVDSRFRPTQVVSLLSPQQRTSHHSCDHPTNATHQRGTPDISLHAVGPRRMTTSESTGGTPDLHLDGDDLGPFLSPAAGKTEKFAAQCKLSLKSSLR